jgi:hypothetical protein
MGEAAAAATTTTGKSNQYTAKFVLVTENDCGPGG